MIKMVGNDKFFKNKITFLKMEGYRIKIAENSYILFEKEEDYLNILYLEKVLFDFNNNLLFKQDKEIRLYFRLSLIEKYIKSLPKFSIKILYDESKFENPFKIKFPNICYLDHYDKREDYMEKITELKRPICERISLEGKFIKVINPVYRKTSIQYYIRKFYKFEYYNRNKYYHKIVFYDGFMFYDPDSDSDSDSD